MGLPSAALLRDRNRPLSLVRLAGSSRLPDQRSAPSETSTLAGRGSGASSSSEAGSMASFRAIFNKEDPRFIVILRGGLT